MFNAPKNKACFIATIAILPNLLLGCASTDEQKNSAKASTTQLSKVEQVVAAKKAKMKANQSANNNKVTKKVNNAKSKVANTGKLQLLAMNADTLKIAKVEAKPKSVGWIKNGAHLQFKDVDFGKGKNTISVEAATPTKGGNVEVRLGGAEGKLLATVAIPKTGKWYNWKKFDAKLNTKVKGKKSVAFVFTGAGNNFLFNVKSFTFDNSVKTAAANVKNKAKAAMGKQPGQILAMNADKLSIAKVEKKRGAVGLIKDGAYIEFNEVNFAQGKKSITVNAASGGKGGNVEVRLGGPQGKLIATVAIPRTGSWGKWQAFDAELNEKVSGKKKVAFVFTGGKGWLFNVQSFLFQ